MPGLTSRPAIITINLSRFILQKPKFALPSFFALIKSTFFFSGVNNGDKSGKTPLHTAILAKQFTIIDRLLECGADVTIKDDAGDTALHTAIRVGSERLVLVGIISHITWKLKQIITTKIIRKKKTSFQTKIVFSARCL